ncbi:unnamed protein product [Parascedosporium putredinis]|uniref:Uncharacterized protein n=1 Tax=Parascedosporium putredinis TaxID=1442378 RepID=A0A9P1H2I1_9PEZI|nr:unnamed protein product [Parascedosporium putredinis]CAI7994944.1 unnamed protein product [Parascedosporium putredinis]
MTKTDIDAKVPLLAEPPSSQRASLPTPLSPLTRLIWYQQYRPEEGDETYLDSRLDGDAEYLQRWMEHLAEFPPRPFIHIRGEHRETERQKDKNETKTVVDFDVKLELTAFLYRDVKTRSAWRTVRTVDNAENVRRGTSLRKRAKGCRRGCRARRNRREAPGPIHLGDDEEVGDQKPTLMEWCHRYCASHAPLKTFRLKRTVQGLDERWLRGRIDSLIRDTGYRGRVNELRLTRWVRWVFYLTLLFLLSWPYLFFSTKRFEVFVADWYFSRPLSPGGEDESETGAGSGSGSGRASGGGHRPEGLMNIWARAIQKAVMSRRQGELDQRDLGWEEMNTAFDRDGDQGVVGTVVGAMGLVQRQFGWGGDT